AGAQPLEVFATGLVVLAIPRVAATDFRRRILCRLVARRFLSSRQQVIKLADPLGLLAPGGAQLGEAVVLAGQDVFSPAIETVERRLEFGFDLGDARGIRLTRAG